MSCECLFWKQPGNQGRNTLGRNVYKSSVKSTSNPLQNCHFLIPFIFSNLSTCNSHPAHTKTLPQPLQTNHPK
jgi:hypothetical protein